MPILGKASGFGVTSFFPPHSIVSMAKLQRIAVPGLALALILLVAAGLRLWHIDSLPPGFHFDESFEGLEAWRILTEPAYKPIFLTGNFGVTPLNSYANAMMFAVFGLFGGAAGPTAMRTTAAVFGILAVLAAYGLGAEMCRIERRLSPAYALLAAAVLAVMRWHVHFSRMGIEPIIVPLVWAGATWLLLRGWRTGSSISFAGCGVVTAASMYTYQAAWVIPFLMIGNVLVLLMHARLSQSHHRQGGATANDGGGQVDVSWPAEQPLVSSQQRLRGLILAGLLAALLVAPLAWFLLRNPDLLLLRPSQIAATDQEAANTGIWQNAWATARMFWPFGATGDPDPRRNLPGAPALSVWLAVPFFLGVGMAVWRTLRGRPPYAILLIGLIGMLLPGALSDNAPHFHRVVGAAAPVALLVALPLDWLWHRPSLVGRSVVVVLVVAATVATVRDYFVRWAALPDLYYAFDAGLWDLGGWIASQPAETPVYLTPRNADHPTLNFAWRSGAANRQTPISFDGRYVFPLSASTTPTTTEKYVVIEHEDFRTPLLLPSVLPEATVEREFLDDAGRVYARVYTRPAGSGSAALPAHPVDAVVGDGIRLMGYDTIPEAPTAGESLFLRLYWEVATQPAGDWTVFTHLLGPPRPDGSVLWAGQDSQPGAGSLPTRHWRPGWRVIDEYRLDLPKDLPPGVHTLEVGLYQPSGERLPATGTGLALGTVTVSKAP